MTNNSVVEFLKKNPALSLSALEKEAGIPNSTLSKVVNGGRKLKDDYLLSLKPVLSRYGYYDMVGAKVLSIANNKGGVGKTTTTANLGKALNLVGNRVLMLDMDPQGNLSQNFGIELPEKQLFHSLLPETNLPLEETIVELGEGFHLSPSDLRLDKATLDLQQMPIAGYKRLRDVIKPVRDKYDYILIDCPPSLGILTGTSLVASTGVVFTVQPEPYSVTGLQNMFNLLDDARDLNAQLSVEGVLFTMVNKNTVVHKQYMEDMREALSHVRIFDSFIRNNISLVESVASRMDIFSYDDKTNGAKDYHKLAKEITNG